MFSELFFFFQADEDQDDGDERWDSDIDLDEDRYISLPYISCLYIRRHPTAMLVTSHLHSKPLPSRVKREIVEPEPKDQVCSNQPLLTLDAWVLNLRVMFSMFV